MCIFLVYAGAAYISYSLIQENDQLEGLGLGIPGFRVSGLRVKFRALVFLWKNHEFQAAQAKTKTIPKKKHKHLENGFKYVYVYTYIYICAYVICNYICICIHMCLPSVCMNTCTCGCLVCQVLNVDGPPAHGVRALCMEAPKPGTQKLCKMMASLALFTNFGPLYYLLLGSNQSQLGALQLGLELQ